MIQNKPAGQYILIITNPDGQLVVSDFTIADGTLIAGKNSRSPNASSNKIPSGYISRCEVYPNPTTNNVTLAVDATSGYLGKIVLISANGKVLSEENYSFSKGINKAVLQT